MSVTIEVRRLFRRSVSRYFALKILSEKGRGNIFEMGGEIMKTCPISYSLTAATYSAWRSLSRLGFIEIQSENAKVNPSLTHKLKKEIEQIEQTVSRLNREGIFLRKSELSADEKEIDRRVAIIEVLKKSNKGLKNQYLLRKFKVWSSQLNEDIRAISEALRNASDEDFVGIQVSNKRLWTEYYLPFKNISIF